MAVPVEIMPRLDADGARRLCDDIRADLTTAGTYVDNARRKLLALYEGCGWLALGYATFRECAAKEFDLTERTLYRRLEEAKVVRELEASFATVAKRTTSQTKGEPATIPIRQIEALAKAPEGDRAEVLDVATEAAGGKPTEKVVKAAVEAKWAKPDATPAELVKTVVNGVAKADAAVERARAAGRIKPDAVVTVEDPGEDATRIEDVAEEHAERAAKADDLTDDEWLATLPLAGKLTGVSLDVFRRDALLWRRMQPPFRSYSHHARVEMKAARKGTSRSTEGQYAANLSWHLRFQDPSRWLVCPPTDKGGCGGAGRIALGPCPMCKERGYLAR
jgi:hypothetical protein